MKFYLDRLEQLFDKITSGAVKALLLYGPDKGYISHVYQELSRKHDFLKISTEYSKTTVLNLEMQLNTPNFFHQRALIKITSVTPAINLELKSVLSSSFLHFPVFIADELTASSSMRQFFETAAGLGSIGCYYDDQLNIVKLVLKKCRQAGKKIDEQALTYLRANLTGDHFAVQNEINKLLFFTDCRLEVTLDDVQKVISNNLPASSDDLCNYFAQNNLDKFLEELAKLQQNNINQVLIIRALIRYYFNLYLVLTKTASGNSLDYAIKSLPVPVFFKYVGDFKKVASALTLHQVVKTLAILQQAESDFKFSSVGFDFYQQLWRNNYPELAP